MSTDTRGTDPAAGDSPLQDFSNCHVGILGNIERLGQLPGLLSRNETSAEVRRTAGDLHRFFREVVMEHHAEEEQELFPAVQESAEPGNESEQVESLVEQLVREHRRLESLWKKIEPDIKRLSRGKPSDLDASVVSALAADYAQHARFEETDFLPLAARILSKNDQSALGLSLHMRHSVKTVRGYI